jgi:hypothetical protein
VTNRLFDVTKWQEQRLETGDRRLEARKKVRG